MRSLLMERCELVCGKPWRPSDHSCWQFYPFVVIVIIMTNLFCCITKWMYAKGISSNQVSEIIGNQKKIPPNKKRLTDSSNLSHERWKKARAIPSYGVASMMSLLTSIVRSGVLLLNDTSILSFSLG